MYLKALECLFAYRAFLHTIKEEETRESSINIMYQKEREKKERWDYLTIVVGFTFVSPMFYSFIMMDENLTKIMVPL